MKNIITHYRSFRHTEYIFLAVLFIIAVLLRLYKINNPIADWHSFRQADTASVTRLYVENGIDLLYPKYHDVSRVQSGLFNPQGYRFVEFPIYNALVAYISILGGRLSLEVWSRLVSIALAISTGLYIYLIGKTIYTKWFGLIAASFYLLIPFNIYFTRVILPEPMAVFLGVSGLYYFLLYTKREKLDYLMVFSILFALGILVKPYIAFYGLVPFLYLYGKYGFGFIRQKKILIATLIIFSPFLFWRFWMSQFPEGIPFWKWTFNGDGIRFHPAFFRWIFGERIGYLILGVWGIIPFFFGLISLKKKDWFLSYLLLGSLLYVSVIATANVRHDYYQTLIIPAVALASSLGVVRMFAINFVRMWKMGFVLVVILGLSFIEGWSQVREYYKIDHPEIIAAGEAVDRLVPKDSLVIASYNGDTAFLYQTKRRGWPVVELPINELIDEGAKYYTSVDLNNKQTQEFETKFKTLEKTSSYVVLDLTNPQ